MKGVIMAETATGTQVEPAEDQRRDHLADELVNRYSAWAAAAGVIPVPILDVVAIGALQLQMLRQLTVIYEVPFSENLGKSLIASTLASVIPAGAAAPALASALKFIPLAGSAVAALSMPAVSARAPHALGKVFILHFASGGTLLDFEPARYRAFMKKVIPG